MRLAYLTTDAVNLDLAERAATTQGATVHLFEPRDGPPGDVARSRLNASEPRRTENWCRTDERRYRE